MIYLLLLVSTLFTSSQDIAGKMPQDSTYSRTREDSGRPALSLETHLVEQKFCSGDDEVATYVMRLRLHYTNRSREPIILHKGSDVVTRVIASKSMEAAAAKEYELVLPLTTFQATVNNPKPVIKDVSYCESTFWFKPSAAYPFIVSPNTDYNIVITLKILENKKHISVSITGTHNQFPYYEAQVNKDNPFYTFDPNSSGPGLYNLNRPAKPISVNPYILREN